MDRWAVIAPMVTKNNKSGEIILFDSMFNGEIGGGDGADAGADSYNSRYVLYQGNN